MPSIIEREFGVPTPLDALWRELEQRLSPTDLAELRETYAQAARRYARAVELRRRQRMIRHWSRDEHKRAYYADIIAAWQAQLDAPMEYIDGGEH
jgi:hypothetical protein